MRSTKDKIYARNAGENEQTDNTTGEIPCSYLLDHYLLISQNGNIKTRSTSNLLGTIKVNPNADRHGDTKNKNNHNQTECNEIDFSDIGNMDRKLPTITF